MDDITSGASATQTGLSPTAEPLRVSSANAASIPSAMQPLILSGYYLDFEHTGVFEIDLILSAVARAGKAYHHTADWSDETPPYDPRFQGKTPLDWIQFAANDAAKAMHASAMSAREGQDPQGLEAQPASAVPQADAHTQSESHS